MISWPDKSATHHTPESLRSSGCDLKGICRRANNPSERIFQSSRLGILELNDLQDSLVMQPRSLEHCTVKALCILKPGNYNGCNLWACRGLVNKIGATMQHLFHNVIAAAFHLVLDRNSVSVTVSAKTIGMCISPDFFFRNQNFSFQIFLNHS